MGLCSCKAYKWKRDTQDTFFPFCFFSLSLCMYIFNWDNLRDKQDKRHIVNQSVGFQATSIANPEGSIHCLINNLAARFESLAWTVHWTLQWSVGEHHCACCFMLNVKCEMSLCLMLRCILPCGIMPCVRLYILLFLVTLFMLPCCKCSIAFYLVLLCLVIDCKFYCSWWYFSSCLVVNAILPCGKLYILSFLVTQFILPCCNLY